MKEVAEKIAGEIQRYGAITYARFMELALYCPVYGYYEKEEDKIGRAGDYYTSVSVGPLFGELLAWQFAEWLGELASSTVTHRPRPRSFGEEGKMQKIEDEDENKDEEDLMIVEAGAHRGELARDILNWLRLNRPSLFERLEYIVVEPSDRRREWQQQMLAGFDGRVRWVGEMPELAHGSSGTGVSGVIFSNELLDAMPVHRLGWDARERRWFEWAVTSKNGQFVWTQTLPAEALDKMALERLRGLAEVLPDGFIVELCPLAEVWWSEAAAVLRSGKLVTLDYGFSAEELRRPERSQGTLRAYYQHRLSDDLLARPGEQDLTAHVNFSAIQSVGETSGLKTELLTTQSRFLTAIASGIWEKSAAWMTQQKREFQTLTHPEHLGERFRVLVQGRR